MEIIAHRGYWIKENEKNTKEAFIRAFESGFGIETDFRDFNGELVISHNIPEGNELSASEFFKIYQKYNVDSFLALNIKADGLQQKLKDLIIKYDIKNYFCFDMSIPDTLGYINHSLAIASRHSEYEQEFPFYEKSDFIWMDCFTSDWFGEMEITKHLDQDKKVCIVSPDLHKREFKNTWITYKNISDKNLMICTDYPDKAKEFFNDKN